MNKGASNYLAVVLACVVSVCCLGCGSILKGTSQTVVVESFPNRSKVEVAGKEYTTPATVRLSKRGDHVITISKEGYESRKVVIGRKVNIGIVILDILFGVVPIVIDAINGAWFDLEPAAINVTLSSIQEGQQNDISVNIAVAGEDSVKITSSTPVQFEIDVREK